MKSFDFSGFEFLKLIKTFEFYKKETGHTLVSELNRTLTGDVANYCALDKCY
jgi:hypothetical protein